MTTKRGGTDIWQVGIVHRPVGEIMARGLSGAGVTWLPEPGRFRFNADPFGLLHDGRFTALVEACDYRSKRGEIHYYSYDADWRLTASGVALREPFHLSYPLLIRDGGDIYMLPEAHRSGRLTLYRAERFPDLWRPAAVFDMSAIDASLIRHDGLWWMFHALPGPDRRAMRELHVSFAEALTGPWRPHAGNPVRVALDSARPGGLPFLYEGAMHLPVQDCTGGYGAALNVLRIEELTPDRFEAAPVRRFLPDVHPDYPDGLHTLAEAGDVTLIDVKRLDRSSRLWVDLERRLRRLAGQR
ncbi:MAG: hypothetical protein WDN06_16765 [Asticcacaulis sp.]